jgi:CubicO group peptidase (beta-lactamase class C family)
MKARTRFLCIGSFLFLALLASLLPTGPARALEKGAPPAAGARVEAQGPTDPQEMEAFLDGVFAEQMEAHQVAGATISVVADGQLFFAKGYGYADVANGKPVVADTTLFGVGSVAKLFVG